MKHDCEVAIVGGGVVGARRCGNAASAPVVLPEKAFLGFFRLEGR